MFCTRTPASQLWLFRFASKRGRRIAGRTAEAQSADGEGRIAWSGAPRAEIDRILFDKGAGAAAADVAMFHPGAAKTSVLDDNAAVYGVPLLRGPSASSTCRDS